MCCIRHGKHANECLIFALETPLFAFSDVFQQFKTTQLKGPRSWRRAQMGLIRSSGWGVIWKAKAEEIDLDSFITLCVRCSSDFYVSIDFGESGTFRIASAN